MISTNWRPAGRSSSPDDRVRSGIDLTTLVGLEFEVQGIHFLGTEECRPCYGMDGALGPGAHAWLTGRGGLRARILTDGVLRRATTA